MRRGGRLRVAVGSLGGVITLVLAGRVPPGGRAALEGFLTEATPFYEAPGGIRVRLLWERAEPDSFVEIVEYADEAAYAADQHRVDEDPAMAAHLTRWRSLLAGPPTVTVYDEATRPAAPPRPAPPAPAPPAPAPPAPPGSGTDRGPEVAEPFQNPTGGALAATPAPLPRTIARPPAPG